MKQPPHLENFVLTPQATVGWQVYILRCADGTLYTGITVDLTKRLDAHQRGMAAKYTRARRPVSLAYQEAQPDRSSALKREAAIRRMGRAGKLALMGSGHPRHPVGLASG